MQDVALRRVTTVFSISIFISPLYPLLKLHNVMQIYTIPEMDISPIANLRCFRKDNMVQMKDYGHTKVSFVIDRRLFAIRKTSA
jgi:hypothetical protein